MANINHIMPKPVVVAIFWGHDYVVNPTTVTNLKQMLSDLVTGPFMNGLVQYGVQRGTLLAPIVIDDTQPPATIVYTDTQNHLRDDITKKLISWIDAGRVPPPPSPSDSNQLYLIFPPPGTTPQMYNGASDPIGNGAQGWHNEGVTNPAPPPTLYWAIVKTNDAGDVTTLDFVNNVAFVACHELVEQCVDRNGTFEEIGDPCVNTAVRYRGWKVQQYHSDWDNGCINGDSPISLKRFLKAIGFDYPHKGLRSLGTSTINLDYIAFTMQSR